MPRTIHLSTFPLPLLLLLAAVTEVPARKRGENMAAGRGRTDIVSLTRTAASAKFTRPLSLNYYSLQIDFTVSRFKLCLTSYSLRLILDICLSSFETNFFLFSSFLHFDMDTFRGFNYPFTRTFNLLTRGRRRVTRRGKKEEEEEGVDNRTLSHLVKITPWKKPKLFSQSFSPRPWKFSIERRRRRRRRP